MLKAILSGKDNIEQIQKINDIPVNPLFDSELELRFMEAIRQKVGAANVSDTIRNGKHSYYVKINDHAWEIEPQVLLGPDEGVKVQCKPDFIFWPISASDHLPVAVFTDGFLYHKDIVSDDTLKREAIRRSGKFRVWSLSFKDVQSIFAPQGDYATATLESERMPYGKVMYQNTVGKIKGKNITPSTENAIDLLIDYLTLPNAEEIFKTQAYAYALSLLNPKLMKNNLAFMNWKEIIDEVSYQTHFTYVDFVFPGTAFGKWIPRSSNAHLQIYAGIIAGELKKQGPVTVCAVLNDEKDQRTDKYENEWNGLWHFTNIMQFSEQFIAVSSTGLQNMNYVALPIVDTFSTPFDEATAGMVVSDGWTELLKSEMAQLFEEETLTFIDMAKDAKIPVPTEDGIGYEVEGNDGEVVATVEIAWPDRKIGYLTVDQLEDKEVLESAGWKILSITDLAGAITLFGGES